MRGVSIILWNGNADLQTTAERHRRLRLELDLYMTQNVIKRRRTSATISSSDIPSAEPHAQGDGPVHETVRALQATTVAKVHLPLLQSNGYDGNNYVYYNSLEACSRGVHVTSSAETHMILLDDHHDQELYCVQPPLNPATLLDEDVIERDNGFNEFHRTIQRPTSHSLSLHKGKNSLLTWQSMMGLPGICGRAPFSAEQCSTLSG